jgi:GT2 family glycosyltransferase
LDVSVIIPARNESNVIDATLDALIPLTRTLDAELIVVDAGSEDGTADVARCHGAAVIREAAIPPGAARNAGARRASGRLYAFLDADVTVTQEWVKRIRELARERDRVPLVTGSRCSINEEAGWIERRWFGAMAHHQGRYINSANLVCDATVFRALAGFSEVLSTGEDVDFCKRARAHGYSLAHDPKLHAIHTRYPSRIADFWIREAWHGAGDGVSIAAIMHSKVAIASLMFAVGLMLLLVSLFAAMPGVSVAAGGFVVLLLVACSFVAFRPAGWRFAVVNIPLYAVYLSARFAALLLPRKMIANWKNSRNRAA